MRERPGHDQVAGVRRGDGAAEDAAARRHDRLGVAVRPPLGLGAVVLGDRPAQDAEAAPVGARLLLGRGRRRRAPGRCRSTRGIGARVDLHGQPEQRAADHEPGMIVRDVGELVGAGRAARRSRRSRRRGGWWCAGPCRRVMPALVERDAGRLEPEPVRRPAGGRRRRGGGCPRRSRPRRRESTTTMRPPRCSTRSIVDARRAARRRRPRSARSTTAAISGSSRGQKPGRPQHDVTSAPSRRWACASSTPIGPPPITIEPLAAARRGRKRSRWSGRATPSSPGIGGAAGARAGREHEAARPDRGAAGHDRARHR